MEIGMEIDSEYSLSSPSKKLKQHNQDAVAKCFDSTTVVEGSTSGSLKSENTNNSTSDLSFDNDNTGDDDVVDEDDDVVDEDDDVVDEDDDEIDEGDDVSDYDDENDFIYYDDDGDDDHYLKMQAQFDNVDLPPGVEASVSWLSEPTPSTNTLLSPTTSLSNGAGTSSSTVSAGSSSAKAELVETEEEVVKKFQAFKNFDVVADFSDHHFATLGYPNQQRSKSWMKKVQEDWRSLEKDLPDTIYVRVYESRMDLLRAVIVGPEGTPYHDGLYVFDVLMPANYPDVPPTVYYYSGGLRINPNLYNCGKVCLSLLNTWSGGKDEMWNPKKSTMLQVLVSIQGLILNVDPFYNEPGYDRHRGEEGRKKSKAYSENVFILSLKTMMYTLRRPPKHFDDLVSSHFRLRSFYILSACKAYLEGAEIGSLIDDNPEEAAKRNINNHPGEFKGSVSKLMNSLVTSFANNGSPNVEQFRIKV